MHKDFPIEDNDPRIPVLRLALRVKEISPSQRHVYAGEDRVGHFYHSEGRWIAFGGDGSKTVAQGRFLYAEYRDAGLDFIAQTYLSEYDRIMAMIRLAEESLDRPSGLEPVPVLVGSVWATFTPGMPAHLDMRAKLPKEEKKDDV